MGYKIMGVLVMGLLVIRLWVRGEKNHIWDGNGAAQREQRQVYLSSAEQASHHGSPFIKAEVLAVSV